MAHSQSRRTAASGVRVAARSPSVAVGVCAAILGGVLAVAVRTITVQAAATVPVTYPAPVTIDMATSSVGWAVVGARILRTVNDGATWRDVTPRYVDRRTSITLVHATEESVWLSVSRYGQPGSNLLVGTAGGRRWQSHVVPGPGQRWVASVAPPSHVWAVTAAVGAAGPTAAEEALTLLSSADNGRRWTSVTHVTVKANTGLPLRGRKSFAFIGTRTGFAFGSWLNRGRVLLYRTRDGGRTWTPATVAIPMRYRDDFSWVGVPVFFGQKLGFVSVGFGNLTGCEGGPTQQVLYRTADGGRTWTPAGKTVSTPATDLSLVDAVTSQVLYRMTFPGKPCAPSIRATLWRSRDGGRTWAAIDTSAFMARASELVFTDSRVGWIVTYSRQDTRARVWHTTDGGRSWSPATLQD